MCPYDATNRRRSASSGSNFLSGRNLIRLSGCHWTVSAGDRRMEQSRHRLRLTRAKKARRICTPGCGRSPSAIRLYRQRGLAAGKVRASVSVSGSGAVAAQVRGECECECGDHCEHGPGRQGRSGHGLRSRRSGHGHEDRRAAAGRIRRVARVGRDQAVRCLRSIRWL